MKNLLSLASKNWLHYGLIVLICGLVGVGGLKLTLTSFAAIPTGTLDIVTYEGSVANGNQIGSVSVVTDQGGSGVQCTPKSGTTDGGGGANHGHVHLTCPAASTGGPRTYVFSSASRDGYRISGASPHAAGSTFRISGGSTTTLSIVMTRDGVATAPAPAPSPAPAPAPSPSPVPSSAPTGTVDIVTYEGSVAGGNQIGSVEVVTDQGGSGVRCTPASGTTQAGSGSNHGHVHLTCPAASDGGPRTYRFVSASRLNFVLSPRSPHPAGDTFRVSAGATTTLSLVMDRVSSLPPPTASPTPAPQPSSAPTGTLDIITYDGSVAGGDKIGSVEVVTDQGGSGVQCTPIKGTTYGGATDGSHTHGHVRLTCPAATDGGPRTYKFASASRFNYVLSPNSPHPAGDTFHIRAGATTTLSLVMARVSSLPPPAPAPAPTPASTTPPPASQKTGSAQVTTYLYRSDGSKKRVAGINLHIQSVNYATADKNHSCNNYNETTESSGTPTTNSEYGQVHFKDCWTGSTGAGKAYQLSYTQLPVGYSFRSFHITGPGGATFTSGDTSNTEGLNEQFKINPNQNTKLEIWLNQNDDDGSDLSNVRQVVTQNGTRYVPANDSEEARQAAAALNLITGRGAVDLIDLDTDDGSDEDDVFGDGDDDFESPSPPGIFNAVQDASGSVALTWQASNGNPSGENITYSVQRTIKNSTDEPEDIGDATTNLTTLDNSDNLEYPKTYVYTIVAYDDSDNTSDEAAVEITTVPLAPNVAAATPGQAANGTDDDSDTTSSPVSTTIIPSPDQHATLIIPDGATQQPLSCSLSDTDSTGDDLLEEIGDVIGDTHTPVCRDGNGDSLDEFDEEVDMSIEEEDSELGDDTELYGFDGTDWEKIPTEDLGTKSDDTIAPATTKSKGNLKYTSAEKTKKGTKVTYTVSTKRILKLALVDRRGGTPAAVTPAVSLMLLVVLGVAARIMVRRKLAENYVNRYGADTDTMQYQYDATEEEQAKPVVYRSEYTEDGQAPDPIQPVEQARFVVHPNKTKDDKDDDEK